MHYLWSDAETSGLNPKKHKVLTAYFAIYNEKMEFLDELDLKVKPDNCQSIADIPFEQEALDVTGINLEDHIKDPATITYSEAAVIITKFLEKHKIPNKRKHFRLSGHNVEFDRGFYLAMLVDEDSWEKLVHPRCLDTMVITTFLQDCNLIPGDLGNLGSLVEYFGIPMGKAHNAREDIKMTVQFYLALLAMMKDKKNNMSGISEHSLLSIVEL
jgi:DNA polymerase III alpha subunit (gram-positive type)